MSPRTLVHAFKYGDRLDLAPLLGALDGARRRGTVRRAPTRSCRCRCTGAGSGRAASTSRRRSPRRSRAKAASRSRMRALRRVKATAQQVGLSRAERATNVQGAFRVASAAQGRGRRAPPDPDRRRADLGRDRRMPARGRCCAPAPRRSTCWCSPGLLTRRKRPYSGLRPTVNGSSGVIWPRW